MSTTSSFIIRRSASRSRLAARKAGIQITSPKSSLPPAEQDEEEQEATDTM